MTNVERFNPSELWTDEYQSLIAIKQVDGAFVTYVRTDCFEGGHPLIRQVQGMALDMKASILDTKMKEAEPA